MKKGEVNRAYRFSDARLVTLGLEKIAFMNRDAEQFELFGITAEMITELETKFHEFSDMATDIESLSDQTGVFAEKEAKAEELRVAIRNVMARVERKFGTNNAKYRKFGTLGLSKLTDSELLIAGKRVVRIGNEFMENLSTNGLTAEMLTDISTLCDDFNELILDLQIKMSERDINQEDRVEKGNAIYETLISYTKTGRVIWETLDVAKYNDYVIYDNAKGEAPTVPVTTPQVQ